MPPPGAGVFLFSDAARRGKNFSCELAALSQVAGKDNFGLGWKCQSPVLHLVYEVRETSRGEKMSDLRTVDIVELDGEVLYDTMDTAIMDITRNWKDYVCDHNAYELIEVTQEDGEILVRYETDEVEEDEEPVRKEVTIPYKYQYLNITYKS